MITQKIAITGASGLLGSALISQLQLISQLKRAPMHLIQLTRPGSRPALPLVSQKESAQGSLARIESIDWNPAIGVADPLQLEGLDAFIHLAGRSIDSARWTRSEKARLRDSRVLATLQLAQQVSGLVRMPRVFVSASAVGYYGDCGADWVSESHPPDDSFLGRLASDWEAAARPLVGVGIQVIHARLGVVLTPQGGALKKMLPIFRLGLAGSLGMGQQYMSWISLEDCIRGLLYLLEHHEANGPYNLVSPQPVTNREFTRSLGAVLHRPTLLQAPRWALRIALGEKADALLLSSCRATPTKLQQLGFEFNFPTLENYLKFAFAKTREDT